MSLSRPPPLPSSKAFDLDITIVSAKHLKNVNWRSGDLKPYAIVWVDPDRCLATKSDDSGNTRPVWNERFLLPITLPLHEASLSLEILHFKPSDTPKPLVGTLRLPLDEISASDSDDSHKVRTFELRRPSGRPHGKIRLKLAIKERPLPPPPAVPDYYSALPSSYYYSTAPPASHPAPPPPPHVRDYRGYAPSPYAPSLSSPSPSPPPPPYSYSDPYLAYYPGYYSPPPPPALPRPFFDRPLNYAVGSGSGSGSGPSAPVDYSPYDQKPKGSKMGAAAAGLGVGLVAGALGGLALEEGLKYEEDKIAERIESDVASRDDYSEYRVDY